MAAPWRMRRNHSRYKHALGPPTSSAAIPTVGGCGYYSRCEGCGAWRFKQADLDSHFDALCGGVCRSTKGKATGGSICGAAEDELDGVLECQTARLRRGSTPEARWLGDARMVERYAHLSPSHVARFADNA